MDKYKQAVTCRRAQVQANVLMQAKTTTAKKKIDVGAHEKKQQFYVDAPK